MKILYYILSIYLLVLLVFPCCAFDDCADDEVKTAQQAHNDDEKNEGTCSPFFNCEKCVSVSIHTDDVTFNSVPPTSQQVYNGFVYSIIPEVHFDFWRPPQLG